MKKGSAIYGVVICLVMLSASTIGCSLFGTDAGMHLGVEIPENEPAVKLASVMENPSGYSNKPVVIKGRVAGQCAALCEFFFQDGIQTVTIYPQGFKLPKLDRGKNVTIYTQVVSGEGQVVFSALGLKIE